MHGGRGARSALEDVDVVLFLVEPCPGRTEDARGQPGQPLHPRAAAARRSKPTFLVINKIDTVPKPLLLPLDRRCSAASSRSRRWCPCPRAAGDGVETLFAAWCSQQLPGGAAAVRPEDMLTDQQERTLVAEYIREQVLRHCRQEIPYSAAVVVDVFDETEREPRPGTPARRARGPGPDRTPPSTWSATARRRSSSASAAQMLKTIGTDARKAIERLLGTHVYLSSGSAWSRAGASAARACKKLGYE